MDENEPARLSGEVTITVTIDADSRTFSADSTTTHNPALVARKLLEAARSDAIKWVEQRQRSEAPTQSFGRRRAQVTAIARAADLREQVQMDTTTTGDVHEAAISLINAAKEELWDWLFNQKNTFASPTK